MKQRFEDKVVLITGASGDIGKACAEAFLKEGASAILHSFKNTDVVEGLINDYPKSSIAHISCDGSSDENVKTSITDGMRKLGVNKIDILVHCAGDLIERRDVEALEWDFIEKSIDTNIKPAFLFTHYVLPHMSSGASIIFISSLTARWGKGDRSSAYSMTKGALLSWSKSLANELGPKGIRVNSVTPGFIEGSFHNKYTKPEVALEHAQRNPLRRVGAPKDVAGGVVFLASEESSYINSVTLDICGGDYVN